MAHNLSSFINENFEPILSAWEKHALDLMGANVSATDARDHAKGMLQAIVADMQEGQTPEEQSDKSKGHGPQEEIGGQAELHGALRQKAGFSISDIASEFRALRATVLRLWKESSATATQSDVDGRAQSPSVNGICPSFSKRFFLLGLNAHHTIPRNDAISTTKYTPYSLKSIAVPFH